MQALIVSSLSFVPKGWKGFGKGIAFFASGYSMGMLNKYGDHGQMGGAETVGNVLSKDENFAELNARSERLAASLANEGDAAYVNHALGMMVAEGNYKMVRMLVEDHGADVTIGMSWALITFVDFAAGKGYLRILKYLLDNGAMCDLDRQSNCDLIGAVDRAAKAGFVDVLKFLVSRGAKVVGVTRRNGVSRHIHPQLAHPITATIMVHPCMCADPFVRPSVSICPQETPAHSAAMHGHIPVLKYLKHLGVDLQQKSIDCVLLRTGVEYKACTPLDYARYYYQTETVKFLEKDAEEAKAPSTLP